MPIYEYECRQCGEQFELLVLKTTVASCPACESRELEQLISGFAVSSESIRQSNIQAARQKYKTSSNYKKIRRSPKPKKSASTARCPRRLPRKKEALDILDRSCAPPGS